jgi:FkbM family methyltransferase
VGAHWGYLTLVAAHCVGSSGKVIAFEPDSRVFEKLVANIELNCLRQVRAFEVAIADCECELSLWVWGEDGWEFAQLIPIDAAREKTLRVQAKPLDVVLDEEGIGNVDLVKIDVEGAEDLVLSGMETGLHSGRYRHILLELHPTQLGRRGRSVRDIAEVLAGHGYHGYSLDSSRAGMRRACYKPWSPVREFVRPLDLEPGSPHRNTVWLAPGQPNRLT